MLKTLSHRHEAFAQGLAMGLSKTEAYARAGYEVDRTAASRLSTNVDIRRRVDQLQVNAAEAAVVTIQSLTNELELARNIAIASRNASAAVTATMAKAKLNGLFDETHHAASIPDTPPPRSNRDLARRIAYILYMAERDRENTPVDISGESGTPILP